MTEQLAALSADEAPQPTFDTLPLSAEVRKAVDELGYKHPTPVQKAVFESAAAGRDIVVQARTGTGKTAAFGLPVVDRIIDLKTAAPQVLILSPTRELALQINRELEKLAVYKGVKCTAVYGGASMGPQVDAIRDGTHVIAGTPGRVLDHLERGTLDPKTIRALVLDESDEMLSMGFLPQITRIMEQLPKKRQTLLFSATLPSDVKRIAETRLTDPEFITLSGDHIGALSIDHFVYRSTGNKSEELIQILDIENPDSAIIFCNTRDQTKRLAGALNRKGFAADWLNADLAQNDREKVMKATREGKLRFLVCTDVAARGIDISHLTHVINADFPESTETYVHRTGRTGRAGNTGTAISLITPQDIGNLYMLRLTYKIFPVERDLPTQGDLQTRKEADLVEFLYAGFRSRPALPSDLSLARRVLTSDFAETIVAGLLRDHLGGHPNAEETAADARRSKSAPPAPKKKDKDREKDKKGKKKHEKDGKKAKEKFADGERDADLEGPPLREVAARLEERSAPQNDAAPEQRGASQNRDTSEDRISEKRGAPENRDTSENRGARENRGASDDRSASDHRSASENRSAPKKQLDHVSRSPSRQALSDGASLTDGLDVISASTLLSDSEKELLAGDGEMPRDSRRKPDRREGGGHKKESPRDDDEEEVERVFVDAGKRDQVFKDDFLATLKKNGFNLDDVVFVKVRDTHSFVGVQPAAIDAAVQALDGHEVAGLEVSAEKARPRRP